MVERQVIWKKDLTTTNLANAKQCDWFEGIGDILTISQAGFVQNFGNMLLESQAEVEQLKAELEKHRWIPISERLPERLPKKGYSQNVWVSDGKRVTEAWYVYESCFEHHNYWASDYHKRPLWLEKDVTHWKPIILPKP